MIQRLTPDTLLQGVQELSDRDSDLARIVEQYGPPPLWERSPGFPTLLRIILEQQVSLASAKAAYEKLEKALDSVTPEHFLKLADEELDTTSHLTSTHSRKGRVAGLIRVSK